MVLDDERQSTQTYENQDQAPGRGVLVAEDPQDQATQGQKKNICRHAGEQRDTEAEPQLSAEVTHVASSGREQ